MALGLAGLVLWLAGCASPPVEEDLPSAEGYYERGLKTLEGRRVFLFFHDVDYPKAIELFQEVIDNYPYSDVATLAELKIADIHFDRGSFEEAQSYYQDFVELHPRHDKVPYAIYRNGLCAFERMRAADRDQAPTREAIQQFSTLLERYPDSEPAADARERLREARDRLANSVIEVADFYFDRGEYHAAIRRYRQALSDWPDHTGHLETMTRLGIALARVRRGHEAEAVLRQVLVNEPDEDLRERVEDELRELNGALSPAASAR